MFKPICTAPPEDMPVTLAEAKAHLHVDSASKDGMIGALLAAAAAKFDGYAGTLGRCLVTQKWLAAYESWPECGDIRLPFPDVAKEGLELTYIDVNEVEQTVAQEFYELLEDELGAFVRLGEYFRAPTLSDDQSDVVRVAFMAGYGDPEKVPGDIKAAIIIWMKYLYRPDLYDLKTITMVVESLTARYSRVGA